LLWVSYLNAEWEHPDPHCFYMMSIAAEVRRVLAKNPNAIKLEDFRLKFRGAVEEKPARPQTREEAAAWSKAVWGARLRAGPQEGS
jgi:hypothetical protein